MTGTLLLIPRAAYGMHAVQSFKVHVRLDPVSDICVNSLWHTIQTIQTSTRALMSPVPPQGSSGICMPSSADWRV